MASAAGVAPCRLCRNWILVTFVHGGGDLIGPLRVRIEENLLSRPPPPPPSSSRSKIHYGLHGHRKRGYMQGIWHSNYLYGGYWHVYPPRKNLTPSHANCMQHVLRCWERHSDGSEYKKTLRRPGLRRRPRWGSLQRSRKPPSWWGGAGCPLPENPIPQLSALRASPLLPTPKLVPTPLMVWHLGTGFVACRGNWSSKRILFCT